MIIRPLATAIAAVLAAGLAAGDAAGASPWHQLPADALGAMRVRGGTPAYDGILAAPATRIWTRPELVAAVERLARAIVASEPELAAAVAKIEARGFAWADLAALCGHECGLAVLTAADAAGPGVAFGMWCTIPDAQWAKLEPVLAEAGGPAGAARSDLAIDGLAITVLKGRGDGARGGLAIHRGADGAVRAVAAPDDPADRLARWIRRPVDEGGLAARAARAGIVAEGDDALTAVVDVGAILALAAARAAPAAGGGPDPMAIAAAVTGWQALGLIGMQESLTGDRLTIDVAAQAAEPRRGILAMLGTAPAPASFPAWIPAEAVDATGMLVDLGAGYRAIIAGMRSALGERAEQQIAMIEGGFPAIAGGMTLDQLFAALGRQWWAVNLPVPTDAPAGSARAAYVLELADGQALTRLLGLASMAGQQAEVRFVTEQGIQGVRIHPPAEEGQPKIDIGIFIAPHHLIIGMGDGVAEEIIAAINRADGRFAGQAVVQAGLGQLPSKPLLAWSVADSKRQMRLAAGQIRQVAESIAGAMRAMSSAPEDSELDAAIAAVVSALPDAETMAGTVEGPAISAVWDADGVVRLRAMSTIVLSR